MPDEIFPEESYDPSTGEYSEVFDFDPVFTYRVEIASGVFADITVTDPDFSPVAQNISDRLDELISGGYFDVEGNRNPNGYPILSDESGFDTQGPNSRGPFISADAVERWLDETGLRDMVDIWYDADNDVYWIDADTN